MAIIKCIVILLVFVGGLQGTAANSTEAEMDIQESNLSVEIFPWFIELLGIAVFYFLNRTTLRLPYTTCMFIVGVVMGVSTSRLYKDDQLAESVRSWTNIDGELLLLIFLPGLIFRDAFSMDPYLFEASISQTFIFAFPMVLAGTASIAAIAFYVFPYGWSFNLALTFGSILAATDPVAVNALLNEVGAPPRLKTHIAGESMLNDGSAVVFFTIFGSRFLSELGEVSESDDEPIGSLLLFLRMTVGGISFGIVFGMLLLAILFMLSKRLLAEENVIQVAATITVAYLNYYVADAVFGTSGIIATVVLGYLIKSLGTINDMELMENFWALVEHLLNTLLFSLGGTVWGSIISNSITSGRAGHFAGVDWLYLLLLFVFVNVIRLVLFILFYPITSRIGLKTDMAETLFSSFAGLRGAVGISLAIALDHEVWSLSENEKARESSSKVFGMVGGIAFLTLLLNGTLSACVLNSLGLTRCTETRKKILKFYTESINKQILDDFIHMLSQDRFSHVDFGFVRYHLPLLRNLTFSELEEAVVENRNSVPTSKYKTPNLKHILPYFADEVGEGSLYRLASSLQPSHEKLESVGLPRKHRMLDIHHIEQRKIFVELLKKAYISQIDRGELDGRLGFVRYKLMAGLNQIEKEVESGRQLCDWEMCRKISESWLSRIKEFPVKMASIASRCVQKKGPTGTCGLARTPMEQIIFILSFVRAHKEAQASFLGQFGGSGSSLGSNCEVILESDSEISQAMKELQAFDADIVQVTVSHFFCISLLNKRARIVESYKSRGLMTEREANEIVEEIEHQITHILHCQRKLHPGEMTREAKSKAFSIRRAFSIRQV